METKPNPTFQIGQAVKAITFVNCFGEQVAETPNLTVTSMKLIERDYIKSYFRITAHQSDGRGFVEGAERFFAAY